MQQCWSDYAPLQQSVFSNTHEAWQTTKPNMSSMTPNNPEPEFKVDLWLELAFIEGHSGLRQKS
jgi:hypothetical protein